VRRTTSRMSWLVGPVVLLAVSGGPGCGRAAKNLPLFAACDSDRDCTSEICAFQTRTDRQGYCTKPCEEDKDCPAGKACTAIVEHAGKSVLACGEPAPLNLPALEGMPGMPPGAGGPPGRPPSRQ
jgi:hypothetical protein